MEYWEFLIQKEGDRTWKPIKSPKIEIEPGRYRVVAHSNLKNAEVEISVIHQSLEEVPPRRRYQKRSRRTSPEGLMVVIPFTQLKSGIWELRCCGDLMSEFMGDSWQESIQLEVGTTVSEVVPKTQAESLLVEGRQKAEGRRQKVFTPTPTQEVALTDVEGRQKANPPYVPPRGESRGQKVFTPNPTQEVALTDEDFQPPISTLPIKVLEENPTFETPQQTTSESQPAVEPTLAETEVAPDTSLSVERKENAERTEQKVFTPTPTQEVTLTYEDFQPPLSTLPIEILEENPTVETLQQIKNPRITENDQDADTANLQLGDNLILEQSLQTLEQIMQQVLEPVLEEFEESESSVEQALVEPTQLPATSADEFSKIITNQLGLILTLEEEALVAQREEPLVIVGQLDVWDVHQLDDPENKRVWQKIFPGILSYELRDPQTSQVVLNVQYPLSEQAPPLTFSQTLELPANCNTRLLVGKITFYGANSQALVSQSFTVTADLDDVLGSILLGGKTMPVETMLAVANHLTTSQEHQEKTTVSASQPLNEALLDLINAPQITQPRTWERSPNNPLPPQLYQKDSAQKSSKSLDLPNFRKLSLASNGESDASEVVSPSISASLALTLSSVLNEVELKQEDSESPNLDNEQLQPEMPVDLVDNLAPNQELATRGEETAPDLQLEVEEIPSPDAMAQEDTVTVADTQLGDSDSIGEADYPELEIPSAENQASQVSADEPKSIENEFQALKLQDRFWSRLNSLVTDADSSTWLESDLSAVSQSAEVEKLRGKLNSNGVTSQQAGVEEPLEFTEELSPDKVMADFDQSLWEGSDDFGDEIPDTANSSFVRLANTNWVNQEVVVEEEPLVSQAKISDGDSSGMVHQGQLESKSAPEITYPAASDVSIPAPELFISTSELNAGEPVTVRIKLLPHPSRLYVKLWIKDRQSRSILDGPRSFVDFLPNASGELEELTQLIVPFGTVEIRFEAIAIDIYSQRESHKVAVECKVVSSDLPGISLEEFET